METNSEPKGIFFFNMRREKREEKKGRARRVCSVYA